MRNFTKSLLPLVIIAVSLSSYATSTSISGTISTNTTLNYDTVRITGNVLISDGKTLTISAGTVVLGDSNCMIEIKGRLLAVGTSSDNILFTASDTSKGWGGLYFNSINENTNDSSKLVYSKLEYVKFHSRNNGAIQVGQSHEILISDCIFVNNKTVLNSYAGGGGGISISQSSPTIINNYFFNNMAYTGGL